MILLNFLEDPFLNNLRFRMGAPLSDGFKPAPVMRGIDPRELERLGNEGVDVSFDQVQVEPDGTLSYKGIRVSVYIRDINIMRHGHGEPEKLPRFHIVYCSTLEKMRRDRRWQRYVVASRDDGQYAINLIKDNIIRSRLERLSVCQNCLSLLQWDQFSYALTRSEKMRIVNGFRLSQFFEVYPRDILSVRPEYTAETAPINEYTSDFGIISEKLKQERGLHCEKCSRSYPAEWLHVHHTDGRRFDNSQHNLVVLCYGCHANMPQHSHMKANPRYDEFIKKWPNWVNAG